MKAWLQQQYLTRADTSMRRMRSSFMHCSLEVMRAVWSLPAVAGSCGGVHVHEQPSAGISNCMNPDHEPC